MHMYVPSLEAAARTVFLLWLQAWQHEIKTTYLFVYLLVVRKVTTEL
jgi:hypothetical protein